MVKAAAPKKQKQRPRNTSKAQSERFKQTAREVGAEESGEQFEKAFAKIVPPKRRERP